MCLSTLPWTAPAPCAPPPSYEELSSLKLPLEQEGLVFFLLSFLEPLFFKSWSGIISKISASIKQI